jgi:hypothetical protein
MEQLQQLMKLMEVLNVKNTSKNKIDDYFINKKVIIRTHSAGVHYGELIEKDGKEVILKNSRRLWYWETANKGISLSEVALAGVSGNSKICGTLDLLWLEAIEIIPCAINSINSIEGQHEYRA